MEAPRTALITGAANGLGAQLANRLASSGYHLALFDLDEEALCAVANSIAGDEDGSRVSTRVVDVSDSDALADALREVEDRFGAVDVCAPFAGLFSAVELDDPDTARLVQAVNLDHVVQCATWAQDRAARQGRGLALILSGSSSGVVRDPQDSYAASKQRLLLEAVRLRRRARRLSRNAGVPQSVTLGIIHLTKTRFGTNSSHVLAASHLASTDHAASLAELDRFLAKRGRPTDTVIDELLVAVDEGRSSIQLTGAERTGIRGRIQIDFALPLLVWTRERRAGVGPGGPSADTRRLARLR